MKVSDTLQFVYRFLNINQKDSLRKIAEKKRSSLNKEVHQAIETHIGKNKKYLK